MYIYALMLWVIQNIFWKYARLAGQEQKMISLLENFTQDKKQKDIQESKKLIDRAIADGSIDRLNNLLSAGHILVCLSNSYIQEASDLMFEKGLLLGELKKRYNDFLLYADRYFTEFATLVDGAKIDILFRLAIY